MNNLIQKILSQKKLVRIIGVLLLIMIIIGIYVFSGIQKNLHAMLTTEEEEPYYPTYPSVKATDKDADLIKRGEYLVKAGDCIACHTNTPEREKAKSFAGGLPMQTPFGTIYAPNITPDKETGIGNWTEEQFIKAMTQGISPSGHYYYPAFPYYYFSKITHDDLRAIKAYLDRIPPVLQKNHPNEMVAPFNQRFLQLGWRMLFFTHQNAGEFKPDPKQSEQWNRGAYIVEGLGHCAMCHSPSYYIVSDKLSLGAPIKKYQLSGAKIQGYLAPNISKANLDKITIDEIVDVFTKDKMIGGGKIKGPMLEANHDSLRYLSHSDLVSIATYLKSVQSTTPPRPTGNVGKAIYENYCSGCHATGAGNAPKFGDPSDWDPLLKNGIDKIYMNAIQGKGGMPAKGTCLSCNDNDIKLSVDYMLASVTGKARKSIPQKPKNLTLADGKRIYEANCSTCHDAGVNHAPKIGNKKAWDPIINMGFLKIFENVVTGQQGHPPHGACPTCSDLELKAAIKYMMQESASGKNYELW